MLRKRSPQFLLPVFGAAIALLAAGCATKAFVRKTVDPIDSRLETVEAQSTENEAEISDLKAKDEALNRDISRVDERALGAQGQADTATNLANEAGRDADGAQELAEDAQGRIDNLKDFVENLDDFEAGLSQSVNFGLNSNDLTPEAKQKLAEIAKEIAGETNYALEVRGFTDTSGPAEHNLRLSRERAEAVVRYLAGEHEVPLYRIHTIGLGSAAPAADNSTRAGRQENRRVEVTVYTAKVDAQMARQ